MRLPGPAAKSTMRVCMAAACIALSWPCFARTARVQAQEPPPITEAKRLRDAHQFAAAARALDVYLADNPADAGVHWMKAQLLYWAGSYTEARSAYERALDITPRDDVLRIDYARFLVATAQLQRARSVLQDVRDPARATDASALNQQILHATSPWARFTADGLSDNQPLRAGAIDLEFGLYPATTTTLSAHVAVRTFSSDSLSIDGPPVLDADVRTSFSPERSPLSLRGELGIEQMRVETAGPGRSGGARATRTARITTGRVSLSARIARETALRGEFSRDGYHATLASLDTLFAVRTIEVALDRAASLRVAGLAAYRNETFGDGNHVQTLYVWALVPVVAHARLGLSAAHQDAAGSTWNGIRYSPYYTPENLTETSGLAELRFGKGPSSVQVNGSYAIYAHEDAPVPNAIGGANTPTFQPRTYSPWSLAAQAATALGRKSSISLRAEHQHTAFYDVTRASITVLWLAR
jgi:hypothetical protein